MFARDSKVVDEDGSAMLRCNQMHPDGLVASTDHDCRAIARSLERMSVTSSNDDFVLLQQALGLGVCQAGLVAGQSLRQADEPNRGVCA
eukprot:1780779-Pyramimonas_sp.AAC.2